MEWRPFSFMPVPVFVLPAAEEAQKRTRTLSQALQSLGATWRESLREGRQSCDLSVTHNLRYRGYMSQSEIHGV